MSNRKSLSWFKGSWLNDQGAGGPPDLEAERWRKRMFTMESGMTPDQFDEAARLQFVQERAPEAPVPDAPAPGGSFNPRQFSRPEDMGFDMGQMESAADSNSILNRQPDQGVRFTPEQKTLKGAYKEMRDRYNRALEAPYLRASATAKGGLRDYTLPEINDLLGRYQNMKAKGLDLSPDEQAQYQALLNEFNTRAKIDVQKPAAGTEHAAAEPMGWGTWFGTVMKNILPFGARTANAAPPPAAPKPGASFDPGKLSGMDKQAWTWAQKNPGHEMAPGIIAKLNKKYGGK